jgi:hypothetical protein
LEGTIMLTIHIIQEDSIDCIDAIHFHDEAGLTVYLRAWGVTVENITKVLEGLVRDGEYTIEQE